MENEWNQQNQQNVNDEFYKKQEIKNKNKKLKKENNQIARMLLLYGIIMIATMIVLFAVFGFGIILSGKGDIDKTFDYLENSGWSYLLSCVFGIILVKTYYKKFYGIKSITHENKKITPKIFLYALTFSVSTQFIFIIVGGLLESLLNIFHFSAIESTEQASAVSITLSMFLYASVLGPIVEELIFRGFVLRVLEPRGKKFAIIVSAFLFAVFHGNLIQGIFAFAIGIVFAYVAIEYSIKWSTALHIFNNMILGDLAGFLKRYVNPSIVNVVVLLFLIVCTIAAIIIGICKRKEIKNNLQEEIQENRIEHPYRNFFSSSWVILYILILGVGVALGSLQML